MNLENFFISAFAGASKYIGDDGAVVGNQVYSVDAFFEDTHFRRSWMSLSQIAYKAMAVNISDAYAMNAVPKFALLSVAIPRHYTPAQVRELGEGFVEAGRAFGCEIIGGDTVGGDKLDISVTVISETSRPLGRSGIRPGDYIAYTGTIGRAQRELRYLLAGGKAHAKSHYVRPVLRPAFVKDATPHLIAGMDVSDGIFTDLDRLARLNRIGFKKLRTISKLEGCSGEEYEMLIAFSPRKRAAVERIAKKHGVALNIFARAARRHYRNVCKSHHF